MSLRMLSLLASAAMPGELETPSFDRERVQTLVRAYEELEKPYVPPLRGGTPLTLESVMSSVEAHHPKLRAAAAKVRQAQGKRLQAEGGFDPHLSVKGGTVPEGYYDVDELNAEVRQHVYLWGTELFGGYRYGRGDHIATYDDRETLDEGEIRGGIRVPLLKGGYIDGTRAALRTTELGLAVADADRQLSQLELALSGAQAYWEWVAAGESLDVATELVRLAELRREQVEHEVARGAAPEIDRAEYLRSVLKRRTKLVEAVRKLEKASIKLSLYLRDDSGQPMLPSPERLPTKVPMAEVGASSFDAGMVRALEERPELQTLALAQEQAEVSGELADNGILPKLDFELAASKDLGTAPEEDTIKSLDPFYLKMSLKLEMPLFLRPGRGKAMESWAKLAETKAKLRYAMDQVRAEVQDVWSALEASYRQARVAAHAADVAEAVAAGERARLFEGATSPYIVNLREQDAAETRLTEIDARASLQVAATAWRLVTMSPELAPD